MSMLDRTDELDPPPDDREVAADGRVRRASLLVALGGFLVVFGVPVIGPLIDLAGIGCVTAGVVGLGNSARDPVAVVRLRIAAVMAAAVAVTMLVLAVASLSLPSGTPLPGWLVGLGAAQGILGVLGGVLVSASMAREMITRSRPAAADAWDAAVLAAVLIHGPLLVTILLDTLTDTQAEVHGGAAVALFTVAMIPYALVARAGCVREKPRR